MKVALISPRGSERNQQDNLMPEIVRELEDHLIFMVDDTEFIPNLGLLAIAACAPGPDYRFIEEDYLPLGDTEKAFFGEKFDLAAISATNYQAMRAYQIADAYRERGVPVVLGGLHPSSLPEEAAQHADAVVIGEGEETFPQLLEDFRRGELKPFYRSGRRVELSQVPPPRYDLIPNPERYNKFPVYATRGCPHDCEFCIFPSLWGRQFKHKTVAQVKREIELIKTIAPHPHINFVDENLLADPAFALELCEALTPLNVTWEAFCDIGAADHPELLGALKKSGCRELLIGLESPNSDALKAVDPWKAGKIAEYPRRIKTIQKAGLPVTGLFIVGFDQDGPEIFRELRNFILKTHLADMDFAVLTPMPGTRLYRRMEAENRITSRDWARYTWQHVNFRPLKMKGEEIEQGLLWLFREFSRPELWEQREEKR